MVDEPSSNSPTIEVDEAAAYFGVTESSDVLHAMMAMPREQAMVQFFELLSDIVLRPGDFDFEAASERMQCEGGEIYYLVAGHLGLMSMPDPILQALGMPDSSGEASGSAVGSMDEQQREALTSLADPMRMMKLFAVAQQTGGSAEVQTYLSTFEGLLADVGSSIPALATIHRELDAALDVAGHVLPIASLASGAASAASVDVPETVTLPEAPPEPDPAPAAAPETTAAPSLPAQDRVPLPGQSSVAAAPIEEPTESIPLPSASVALPDVAEEAESEPVVNVENDREVARATQDAFAGAFSSQLEPEPVAQPTEPIAEPPEEEEFVSAAEHFIAADEDGSGALDVEELARATGTTIEEAAELHAEADTDGDGVVSLSEFIASPAAEKTAGLPKPVAPVRRPLGQPGQAAAQPNPVQQRPQPLQPSSQPPMGQPPMQPQGWQQQPMQPQGWQQQPMQPQGWQQPQRPLVQPTIRSGIHCRGCGIGLDPYWRFCPVCGQQNLGY